MAKGDVLVRMKADVGNYNANLANARRTLQGFKEDNLSLGGVIKNMTRTFTGYAAGLMSIGAVAGKLHETVTEAVALAKAGEGIRMAFSRLNDPNLLKGLREATHGTVADVELMKAAVKFDDFKLPVSELGTMLAFAQKKAKDTGQSVDYMVDSIVTGLGRKSLMILDNLGLSATDVKERMKETGDMTKAVGEIIREQMAKSGDYVETAADRAAQSAATMQNKMEELGRKFAPLEEASSSLWTSMKLGILDVVSGPLTRLINGLTEAGRLRNMLNDLNGESGSGNTQVDQQLKKLKAIRNAGGSDYVFNYFRSSIQEDYNRQIMALDAQIKNGGKKLGAGSGESQDVRYLQQKMDALIVMRNEFLAGARDIQKPVKVGIKTENAEENIESLTVKLAELEAQRKKAIMSGDQDLAKSLTKQINQTKSLIKALDPNALKTTTLKKPEEILPVGSVAALNKELQDLQKQQSKVTNTGEWKEYEEQIRAIGDEIKIIKGELGAGGLAIASGVSIAGGKGKSAIDRESIDKRMENFSLNVGKDLAKQGEQAQRAWSLAAQAVSSVGDAFNSIEDPGVKAMGTITQAIASIALGFAQASVTAASLGPFGWVSFLAAGAAALATTIGTVHSLTNLSGGGFITGNSYSGDNIKANGGYVGLNAGELVLNASQQNNLANRLQSSSNENRLANYRPYAQAETIYFGLANYVHRSGKGEIVIPK